MLLPVICRKRENPDRGRNGYPGTAVFAEMGGALLAKVGEEESEALEEAL